jgi:hypothetical protein
MYLGKGVATGPIQALRLQGATNDRTIRLRPSLPSGGSAPGQCADALALHLGRMDSEHLRADVQDPSLRVETFDNPTHKALGKPMGTRKNADAFCFRPVLPRCGVFESNVAATLAPHVGRMHFEGGCTGRVPR